MKQWLLQDKYSALLKRIIASPEKYSLRENKYAFGREIYAKGIYFSVANTKYFSLTQSNISPIPRQYFSFDPTNYSTFLINKNAIIIKNSPYANIHLKPIRSNTTPSNGGDTILAIDENK